MISQRFRLTYPLQGMRKLLIRNGYSCRVPARRALEGDEVAVTGWVKEIWPDVEDPRQRSAPRTSSKTRPACR
ncbi:winged helix-turn-helix domain-containing protein [Streptosporangium sp. NPDC000239]|uniref:helix-turn-helix domain-containing protein n=1 Tax=Streptosporangium sp. NPDC000239 TaxID=3154248 RepID=UPI003332FA43